MDHRQNTRHRNPNSDWGYNYSGQRSGHSSMNYGQNSDHYQQPFQNKFPEEWKNPKRDEIKRRKMKTRRGRSAINPFVKHFLFTVNILFLVIGASITGLSIYVLLDEDETIGCFLDFVFSPACLLCLLGCLVFVPSLMGCYGALRENTCILKMYLAMAILLIVIEIVLIVAFFTFTLVPDALENLGLYPADFLEESLLKYGRRVHEEDGCGRNSDDYLDLIQDKFSCCGSSDDDEGYRDWENNPYYGCNSSTPEKCSVPISCCKADTTTSDCGANLLESTVTDLSAIYIQGCEKGMRKVFEDNIFIIGCSSVGGLLLQIFFTCCTLRLNSQVNEQRSKW